MDSRYAAMAAAQSDTGSQRLTVPRPTGPYAVGRETLHLVDHTRPDPWMPEARARELMVSMYYPARAGTGRPAQYLTTTEAQLLLEDRGLGDTVPAKTLLPQQQRLRGLGAQLAAAGRLEALAHGHRQRAH